MTVNSSRKTRTAAVSKKEVSFHPEFRSFISSLRREIKRGKKLRRSEERKKTKRIETELKRREEKRRRKERSKSFWYLLFCAVVQQFIFHFTVPLSFSFPSLFLHAQLRVEMRWKRERRTTDRAVTDSQLLSSSFLLLHAKYKYKSKCWLILLASPFDLRFPFFFSTALSLSLYRPPFEPKKNRVKWRTWATVLFRVSRDSVVVQQCAPLHWHRLPPHQLRHHNNNNNSNQLTWSILP